MADYKASYADRAELVITEVLRAAVAAPSLHNTQPWRLRADTLGMAIEIYVDPARMLPVGDPYGRSAYLACGAALLNLRVAAAANGLQTRVVLAPDPDRPHLVARVGLSDGYLATPSDRELSAAIRQRHSNRQPYRDEVLAPDVKAELVGAAKAEQGLLLFLDENEVTRVGHLIAEAERELLAKPAYRTELARWVGGERAEDGVPSTALGPRSESGRDPVRDFLPARTEPVRYASFEELPQLAVLSVATNSCVGWITAGQALERVWLTATCLGVSVCPLTQPFETRDAWLVRARRHGVGHPQMILRLGYGPPTTGRAPRRPVTDVVTWS
jgi:nitroreductase